MPEPTTPNPDSAATNESDELLPGAAPDDNSGPEVKPPTPSGAPVKPETPNDDETAKKLAEAERQRDEARSLARKRSDALRAERQNSGNYEALYTDAQKELSEYQHKVDLLEPQVETLTAERDSLKKELEGYRKSLVERFDEADRELADATPLSKLEALYARLNPEQPNLQYVPPPSPGVGKVNGRSTTPKGPSNLSEYIQQRYNGK